MQLYCQLQPPPLASRVSGTHPTGRQQPINTSSQTAHLHEEEDNLAGDVAADPVDVHVPTARHPAEHVHSSTPSSQATSAYPQHKRVQSTCSTNTVQSVYTAHVHSSTPNSQSTSAHPQHKNTANNNNDVTLGFLQHRHLLYMGTRPTSIG